MNKILLTIIIVYLPICLWGQSDTGYIRRIFANLNQIKSASYFWYQSASALYDTIPSLRYNVFIKEFDNPEDKFVGARIANFQFDDTTKLVYFYDGMVQSYLDWENKTIPVDSFQNNRYLFRVVYPPFFTQVKCLLKYALETPDNKIIQVKDFVDSVLIRLYVYDKLAEVVGNRIVYADPPDLTEDKWTKYDFWINKLNNLPFRLVKRFPDRVCWEVCKDIKINTTDKIVFVALEYFPPDFAIQLNENIKSREKSLEGIAAPGWKLKDTDNNDIALGDLKNKVLLIQFTGIGCGPCYQSIPYLVKIRDQFNRDDFEIISIETWNNDISVIKKHISANRINYKYLVGNSEVKPKYGIQSVPKFFVLDENRVIRKIISGFDKEKTYGELKEIVDQLIQEHSNPH
jgi:thiol-disulfide isomerase/thioredoxin